jgi:hypothetical protein
MESGSAIRSTLVPLITNSHASGFALSESARQRLWFPFASIFEHLMKFLDGDGAEDDPELDEMRQRLAKFAAGDKEALKKFYIDPAERDDRVQLRCERLVELGAVRALHELVTQMVELREQGKHSGSRSGYGDDTGLSSKPTPSQTPIVSKTAAGSLSKSLLSIARPIKTRGQVVAQGGVKSLLAMIGVAESEAALSADGIDGDDDWKNVRLRCSHGLARLSIAVDPFAAFTEGTATKIASAVLDLLRVPEEGMAQFEALMALTNLSLLGHAVVAIILRDGGISRVESAQLASQPLLQRAACELACNLTQYEPHRLAFRVASPVLDPQHPQFEAAAAQLVRDTFLREWEEKEGREKKDGGKKDGENANANASEKERAISKAMEIAEVRTERQLKIFAALTTSDDEKTAVAASGALAMLSGDGIICARILDICGLQPFIELVGGDIAPDEGDDDEPESGDANAGGDKPPYTTGDLQHRGAEVLKNCIRLGRPEAKRVMDADAVPALIKCLARPLSAGAAEACSVALKMLQKWDLLPSTEA